MEAFVGLVVRLALDGSDGRIVQGQVAHVNEAHQVLTLSQCSVLQDSVISLHDRLSVRGSEIADLVLVNASTPPLQGRLSSSGKSSSSRAPLRQEPIVQTDDDDTPVIQFTDYLKKASEPRASGAEGNGTSRKKKSATGPSSPKQTKGPDTRTQTTKTSKKKATFNNTSYEVDMSQDFDFQGSLALFDKAEVFAEIRESDAVDPESRLVAHNRLKKGNVDPQRKLGIHENVLDGGGSGKTELSAEELVKQLVLTSSTSLSLTTTTGTGQTLEQNQQQHTEILYSISGIPVPTLSVDELLEAVRIASTETGPNPDQMTENGGRTAAMLTLQALGGNRRIKPGNHNERPLIVVMVGNNRTGAFGLSAARHLANHDCQVLVWVLGKDSDLLSNVAYQKRIFLSSGGQVLSSINDLPHPSSQPVDFILDALLGSSGSLSSLLRPSDRSDLMTVIQWANTNRAPMLSLDLPSGLLDVSGSPHRVSAVIEPKFLLSLGLPLSHLLYAPQTLTPELFLADIGLPCGLLSRVLTAQKSHSSHSVGDRGAVPYLSPFGDKFVVGLRRGSL